MTAMRCATVVSRAPYCLALLCAVAAPAMAQEATPLPTEPKVQHIVIEDKITRIEELRVRGETQRVVVRPKMPGARPYEIVPADGARDIAPGPNSAKGAAGHSVWNVFSF
jgi:hypothetical protein